MKITKTNISSKKVESLEELLKIINEHFAHWPNYIFRGHAQSDWLLEPTLSRTLKKIEFKDKQVLVKEHLERFKLEIRGRRGVNPRQLSENEFWALGQHFGLQTPLLDWTQSPYVALFFALIKPEISATGYRSLWGFHSTDIELINSWYSDKKLKKSKYQVELINPILDENSRLVNQNGLFIKINLDNDLYKWVLNGPSLDWITLYRIDFPDSIREETILHLDLMNINYSSLFPELFGSSMHCNVKLGQIDYVYKQQERIWIDVKGNNK
jgi:hypothetical protein